MAYGTQVLMSNGVDMVSVVRPLFYLDNITDGSGSRSYSVPAGKTLMVMHSVTFSQGSSTATTATISGNTVTYSNTTQQRPLIVYAG